MPALTDHHRRLQTLVGHFIGTDVVAATPWGAGGVAEGEITSALTLGDTWLALDHVQHRDGQTVFAGHGRLTWDAETSDYAMLWFDSFGFVPPSAARGSWTANGLELIRTSPRGMARHLLRPGADGALSVAIDNSFDRGATWVPVMTGEYRRA